VKLKDYRDHVPMINRPRHKAKATSLKKRKNARRFRKAVFRYVDQPKVDKTLVVGI
jgi:hypothetical protein